MPLQKSSALISTNEKRKCKILNPFLLSCQDNLDFILVILK